MRFPRKTKKVVASVIAGGFPTKGTRSHRRLRRWARIVGRLPTVRVFDHNGECLFCDGLGAHEPDCQWLNQVNYATRVEQA